MRIMDHIGIDSYLDKISNGIPFVIHKSSLPEISWDEILEVLNEDIISNNINAKTWMNEYGFRVSNSQRIDKISEVAQDIQKHFSPGVRPDGEDKYINEIYVSLTTQERSYGGKKHTDTENVLFWGLRGISNWTIYDANDEIALSTDIMPGDMIFCPANMTHRVFAKTPRAAASFGFGKLKEQF